MFPPAAPALKTALPSSVVGVNDDVVSPASPASATAEDALFRDEDPGQPGHGSRPKWYSYFLTREFWTVLAVGQICALCTTSTNTFNTFITDAGTNIPAFQTLFTYALITLIYTPIFIFYEGPKKWAKTLVSVTIRFPRRESTENGRFRFIKRSVNLGMAWRYFIFAFLDVQGNYFTVKAYQNTNLLSAQLINFWSIVCVVAISFALLGVRYRVFQVIGILVCCAGMGILLASDQMTSDDDSARDAIKGDLFALLGATCYGISNVFEEWMVSKRPMYEVLAFLGVFGAIINGVQAAIFDREGIATAHWDGRVIGFMVGFTLALVLFYTLAPLVLRMGSAAFFDISLLTANFWGVIIGTRVFGLKVHFLYPVAFVLILVGLVAYFLAGRGDSSKPWLGEGQEGGVDGIGTARRRELNETRRRRADMVNP